MGHTPKCPPAQPSGPALRPAPAPKAPCTLRRYFGIPEYPASPYRTVANCSGFRCGNCTTWGLKYKKHKTAAIAEATGGPLTFTVLGGLLLLAALGMRLMLRAVLRVRAERPDWGAKEKTEGGRDGGAAHSVGLGSARAQGVGGRLYGRGHAAMHSEESPLLDEDENAAL